MASSDESTTITTFKNSEILATDAYNSDTATLMEHSTELTEKTEVSETSTDVKDKPDKINETLTDTQTAFIDTPKTDSDGSAVLTDSDVSSTTSVVTDKPPDTPMESMETSTPSETTSYIVADPTALSSSTATDSPTDTEAAATESLMILTTVSTEEIPSTSREPSETYAGSDIPISYLITDTYTSPPSTGLSIGVSTGLIVIILFGSLYAILRIRSKWRTKLQENRNNMSNVWTTQTHNNTIVNENFMDYNLVSTNFTPKNISKHDQKGLITLPQISFDFPNPNYSSNTSSLDEMEEEFSTKQCHAVSPDGLLTVPEKSLAMRQKSDPFPSHTNVQAAKERPATFTSGKKETQDRRVLLRHEEVVDDDFIASLDQLPKNSSVEEIITEL